MSNSHDISGIDAGLEALDTFLASDEAPPEAMMLSDLDGFLTGIAIGPELIMPSEWMPVVWGGSEPIFADSTQAQAILGTIMKRYNDILVQVEDGLIDPIFWTTADGTLIAADWAEGFVLAIGFRPRAWEPLLKSKRHAHLLLPILGLCGDETGQSALGLDAGDEEELASQAPDLIPACVEEIARFWRTRNGRQPASFQAAARTSPKVGRNDPCPCGSGRKFKKCCGNGLGTA
ncbi:UPF0149 family protein [Nitrospirillum viridazoti]|uniref:YecA family protein n=1 Tax=Nitrospirillum amazonense TaxID=28077 RepID=A0A560IHP4_9PROT|nr:UPF0149 family protein [Nitrospirillum amazonense]TWB56614.1 uncharacterized protein FBZ92_11034 [Nitrospirillum amazonense]